MQSYLEIFNALKAERSAEFLSSHGLVIKTGEGLGAVLLKVMKPSWSTDDPQALLNSNGLFFGIWIDAACEAQGILRYNLHAKKLRAIKSETFAAREFARVFRVQGQEQLEKWPNWSYPKGPITLFEGHIPLDAKTLHADTSKLMDHFAEMTPLLEQLLAD
jgi:hypothetical protein